MNEMSDSKRKRLYLILAVVTQCLNAAFIVGTAIRQNTPLSSLLVGGIGRVLSDGILLYLAYKGKSWAKALLILLWVGVIGVCVLVLSGSLGSSPGVEGKVGVSIIAATYALLSLVLGLTDRSENNRVENIAANAPNPHP